MITPLSIFTRNPNSVFNNNHPYDIIVSHNKPKGVVIKPEIFEKIIQSPLWKEICEEYWEINNKETCLAVAQGKHMKKIGDYTHAKKFS